MEKNIRSATQMERARAKAIGLSAFLVVLMLTVAITFTAIALGNPKKDGEDDGKPGEVTAPIAFSLPISGAYTLLKEYMDDELQYNITTKRWEGHKAVDFAADLGTNVVATYPGTVTSVINNAMYGTVVTIEHEGGLKTVYSSLDKNVSVSSGDVVEKGQKIGTVGNTAAIEELDPPHIHLEVYKNNVKVNPADYIDFSAK